eukprot:XP_001695563.1 microtubule associated protein [Chlamydomonas reinhardtii]
MADDKDVRELADAKKLPLPDRIAHTNWKARVAAYDDISVACREIYDDADPKLSEFAPLFAKAVSEPNAAAVDKALDALSAFLSKASEQHASRICERTCANMVAKCLSARTSTLTRVLEVMLLFVELEQADKVTEALVVGLSNKNPKVVVAALEMIYNTINLFGHRVVTPKPIMVALPALFESKDGKAREKVKEIVVELSRWMGPDAIRAVLFDKMRDAMRDDISRAMELAEPARVPPRLTRKQQAKAADVQEHAPVAEAAADGAAGGVAPMEEDMPEAADPYDYAEPKKVVQELTSANFFAKLEEKKWTDRRDAVLFLKGLADTPRIASGDFGDVMRELKKLISKDSNVVVVAESINCVGLLAKGLRKEFASWARNLASALLEKFKEKNTNVGIAVTTALTYMHKYCWHLSEVVEDLPEAMGHANPKVKEDTYKWLTEAIKQEPKANLKGLVPTLMGAAAKGAEEAAPALREAAQGFMVAFTVRFGNTAVLDKFTTKMDEARKKKLQVRASIAPSLSLKSRLPAGGSRPTTAARPSTAAPAGGAAAPKKAAAGGDGDDEASLGGGSLSRDQAVAALTDMFGEALVKALQDDQWKTRLDAMETVAGRSADPSVAASSGSMLVQAMSHVPSAGWGEKNFQVMAKQFEILRNIAAGNPAFSKRDAFTCLGGLIDKVGDLKLKQPSFETLTCLAEAVGPQFVMAQLHKKAASHKNPKVQSEAINWIARAITEFGLAGCDVRALLDWAKEDLGSANAGVRNAAIQMLGVMYRFLGPALGDMIRADVKPALMTAIDGEFAKVADLGKPEPTRFSRVITGELVTQLGSANWKERKAALDSIETILTQAGNRIQPQTGELLPELKKRLADSNKNLTTQALTVLGRIAKAMGRAIDRNAKPLLAPAVKNITDQKQTVRAAVTEMLDAWVGVTSSSAVMSEVVEFYTSPKITADGKTETLRWLASLVAAGKLGECAGDALKTAVLGGADKAVEVRDAASKLMVALVEAVGPAELGAAAQGLDVNSRKAALEAITKVTGAPVPVAAAAPAAAAASSRPSTATQHRAAGHCQARRRPPQQGRFRPAKLQIMPDEPQTLEAELGPLLSPALKAAAFSKDFKKHCEAADMITRSLPTNYDDVIAVVDLLFRWSTLRILESNTASLVKVLELLKLLLEMMIERGYRMSEYESKLILPAVVEKSGHNQDKLKAEHRELLRRFALVHPPAKVLAYVKDGLESKNSKTRVVCMDEIAAIVDRNGPVLYCIEGAAIWEHLGRLTDQQKSLIEERIKAAGNRMARAGQVPGYKAAEYSLAPVQPSSPMQATAQPAAAAVDPAVAAAAGYDVRRVSSPMMMNRYNSFQMQPGQMPAVGASMGVLTMLDGGSEEETIRNWVIMLDRLQGVDWEEAIQAMKLLCFSYMEVDRQSRHVEALLMDPRNVDELVLVLAGRLDQSLWDASASTLCLPGGPQYNARACKYSINALMNMCNLHPLTARIGDAALTKMFSALLAALIDARLRQVADGDGLLKAVNMMIMKLLEQASRSGVFGALVALLRTPNPRIYEMATSASSLEAARAENLLRWNDMVVKCLIKMTKQLSTIIPIINVGEVLVHLHRYMQALGAEEVRRRSSLEDKPLRMVKTMLHELCKHRGYDIYKDIENMPAAPRPRGIPSAFSGSANTPTAAQSQVLAPLSTNAMAPPQQPGAAASPKVSLPVVAAPAAAAAPALATSTSAPLNLDPSSAEFTRPVTDEQEARNILAAIFKRIGDKSQSNQALVDLHHFMEANPNIDVLNQMMSQVSPYFKTYLSRGLNKVKLQMSHAAAAAAAVQEQQPAAFAAVPAPAGRQESSDGGMAPSGTARTASSTWSTPDGDASAHPTVITIAEKLAISEARSPASPGRLRGVGNLDELRSRMNNLSTNLSDLPLRASNPAVAQSAAMSQDLLDLQERMKKIQNLGAAS